MSNIKTLNTLNFDDVYPGVVSSSTQVTGLLPTGTVSSSAQASTWTVASASVATSASWANSSSFNNLTNRPSGLVSSSAQMPVSSFSNGADNRVVTATSTNGINGEANLTFDGNTLRVDGTISGSTFRLSGGTTFPVSQQFAFPASFTNATGDFAQMWQHSGNINILGVSGQTNVPAWVGFVTNNSRQFRIVVNGGNNYIFGDTSLTTPGNIVVSGSILFPDNTYDIGTSGANRPRDVFIARNLSVNGSGSFTGRLRVNGNLGINTDPLASDGHLTIQNGTSDPSIAFKGRSTDDGAAVRWFTNDGLTFRAAVVFVNDSAGLRMITQSSSSLSFVTNNTTRWQMGGSSGHILAGADNAYDIGASGTNRPRDLFLARNLSVAGNTTLGDSATDLTTVSGPMNVGTSISSQDAYIQVGHSRTGIGYAYIDLVGDTTYTDYGLRVVRNNAGANTTSQIAHRGTGELLITAVDAGAIALQTNSTSRFLIGASSGHFLAAADNTYDIGASGANRPRDIFVGTSVRSPALIASSRIESNGYSTSYGVTGSVLTTGFNVIMGTGASATWMFTGTSGGSFRGGYQILDAGSVSRLYLGGNFLQFATGSATRLDISNLGNLTLNGTISTPTSVTANTELLLSSTSGSISTRRNSNSVEHHIRPNSGRSGWVSFTEDSVADRWVVGIRNSDSNFYFATGTPASNTTRVTISNTGNITAADFTLSSDIRLKENLVKIDGALEKITSLSGYQYNFRDSDKKRLGVIAQEVRAVAPEAVTENKEGYLGVSYDTLVPLLIEAIKELNEKLEKCKCH